MVVCLGRIFIQNTYAKFTSGYETGNDIANLNLSFDVKISNLEEYEEISVDANSYEVFNVNVKNSSSNTVYYGVWYMMASPKEKSSDIVIARSSDSTVNTSGSIVSSKDVTVTIVIKNNSSSNIKVNIGVVSSLKSTSDIEYLGGKKLINENTIVPYSLSNVPVGSYVKYTGNNGCSGKACEGENANYVSSSDMGYCYNSKFKYSSNGWRVAYIQNGSAYLTTGGSPECMSTDENGVASSEIVSTFEVTGGAPKHRANLNAYALKYCNSTYAYGGICNSSSIWNMNETDFKKITGSTLSLTSCYKLSENKNCGYQNDLIDNTGFYWYSEMVASDSYNTFYWDPNMRVNDFSYSRFNLGIRPVIRLKSSVVVTGGSGTMSDPFILSLNTSKKLSDVSVGSYIKYVGNNGCSGKACEGENANYVDSSDMGYCYNSKFKYSSNGWRVAYIQNGSAYLTTGGSPECMSTDENGVASSEIVSTFEVTGGAPKHRANLNAYALKYCNSTYAYGGICNSSSIWNMNETDFKKITGSTLSLTSCYKLSENKNCGYQNDLIDNAGFYWYSEMDSSNSHNTFYWDPNMRVNDFSYSRFNLGIRPVIRLKSSIVVTGGSGTMEDPYVISNG